jgi:osmotically-inducible protein OsmY
MKKPLMILTLLSSPFALTSCVPVIAAGAGAAVGVAAVQEGGVSQAASDLAIQASINDLWFKYNFEMFRKLDMTVDQGRVLITGVVQDPKHRVEAVRLAWQPAGVKQVINEIKVADSEGFMGYAKDAWITTRLRALLLIDREVESLNYSVDTVQGSVYLMGYAQDQRELDRVIQKARTVENVRSVVSYVKMVGSPPVERGNPSPVQQTSSPAPDSADLWGENQGNQTPVYDNAPVENQPYGQEFNHQPQPVDVPAEPYGQQQGGGGGAPVPPVSGGEPINWNDSSGRL